MASLNRIGVAKRTGNVVKIEGRWVPVYEGSVFDVKALPAYRMSLDFVLYGDDFWADVVSKLSRLGG